jgi:MoxR-like ATPase
MDSNIKAVGDRVQAEAAGLKRLREEIHKVIVGQEQLVDRLIMALIVDGHVLLEGLPGLAKTKSIATLAKAIDTGFQRIQFTPDLLPADILGTQIYNPKTGDFSTKKGPIFSNIILADEINRAPAKVQSALLEAMQERRVTIAGETYVLPAPFLVMATQNPIEQEGTYPLPEAQVDRFTFKVEITYPSKLDELKVMDRMTAPEEEKVQAVMSPEDIFRARKLLREVYVDDRIKNYILNIIQATRKPEDFKLDIKRHIMYGASPRATIFLNLAARANAFMNGRGFVVPEDVKAIAPDVLRHRVIVTYEAEAEELRSVDIIKKIFDKVEVP